MLIDLKNLIIEKSYRKGDFVLSSGQSTKYFFDLKPVMLDPWGANLVADEILDKLLQLDQTNSIDAIGGIAMGSVPIVSVASAKSYIAANGYHIGKSIPAFFIRKAPKDHGTSKLVEGDIHTGNRVVLIEDVTTTAGSVIFGINTVRALGCVIEDVITVVDRLEGAEANLNAIGVKLHPLLTRMDFDP